MLLQLWGAPPIARLLGLGIGLGIGLWLGIRLGLRLGLRCVCAVGTVNCANAMAMAMAMANANYANATCAIANCIVLYCDPHAGFACATHHSVHHHLVVTFMGEYMGENWRR